MRVGILGTGRMGTAMGQRLLGLGFAVTAWNRTRAKTAPLAQAGAEVAPTAREAAERCDVVVSVLTDAAAIAGAYDGGDGALAGDVKGKLFIDMSTVRPETAAALAARVRARGAAFVDCPVGGSVGPAKEGKLLGFAGGEDADVARARPLLERLCRRVEHVGPAGAGARMKLVINLPLLVYWEALAEALALCAPLGLDPARVMDILADTSGGPNVLRTRGAALAAALKGQEPAAVTVDIETMRKDLRTMVEEARAGGFDLPVTARALECYDEVVAQGKGGRDITTFAVRKLGPGPRRDA